MTTEIADMTSARLEPLSVNNGHMDRAPVPAYPLGQRLLFWLGHCAREMRVAADVTMPQLAVLLDRKDTKPIERFERAENFPQSLEELLAAYGELIGVDPREIVAAAVRKWQQDGEAPQLASTLPANPPSELGSVLEQTAKDVAHTQAAGRAGRARGRTSRHRKPGAS